LQDHQGNNRVVIDQNGTVEETNNYYPFGGVFANSTNVQPYKYNGKELDTKKGLNWYDYGARHYDAAVGRFATVDPMAEKYYFWSPYAYCLDNPIKYIDPNGMQSDDTIVDGGTLPEVTITRVRVAPPISGFWDNLLWFLFGRSMEIPVYGIDNYGNPTGEIVGSSQFNVSRNGYIIGLTPRSGIAPLPSLGIKNITQLLKIANQNSKAGLTAVGRALKKHGDRIGSAFPKAVGNQAAINAQGEKVLKEILSNPNVQRTVNNNNIGRYGGSVVDYKIPNGMEARFNSNESKFIGFLEP
ncbi:MAG: RHS repeat domain-containing protein, partial [Phocaeicola sp.]